MAGTKNNIIDRRFVHFKNYDTFLQEINGEVDYVEDKLVYGNLKRNSIVWISDKQLVWTHGKFYPLFNLKGINELDLPEDLALQEDDGLLLALGKLQKRADNIDNILVNIPNNYIKIDGTNGTKEGLSTLIKKLDAGDADVTDTTSFITSHIQGDAAQPLYYRRSATYLLNYIHSKSDPRYVNVTGDTMTGALTITTDTTQPLILKGHDTGSYIQFGKGGVGAEVGWYDGLGAYLQNDKLTIKPTICLDTNDLNSAKFSTGSTRYIIWHAGNDGPNSGLDADLLDGQHETAFLRYRGNIPTAFVDITDYNTGASAYANYAPGIYNINLSEHTELFINFAKNNGSTSALQFKTNYSASAPLYFRKTIDANRVSGAWTTILTNLNIGSYNAGSADKLSTTRYLWGQPFNGEGNVTGSLSDVLDIKMSRYLFFKNSDATLGYYFESSTNGDLSISKHNNYAYTANVMKLLANGNVGIGTAAPAYKLDVAGSIAASNDIYLTGYSKIQFKEYNYGDKFGIWGYFSGADDENKMFIGSAVGAQGTDPALEAKITMLLKSGNVGIGTTSPASKLDVNGNIQSQGFVKNGSSDSYLLLGGGGHKAISDFVTASSLADYLPLTGGTLTGDLYIYSNNSSNQYKLLGVGYSGGNRAYLHNPSWTGDRNAALSLYNSTSHLGSVVLSDSGVFYRSAADVNNTIWHSGNDGKDSGLDADLLDGVSGGGYARNILNEAIDANDYNAMPGLWGGKLFNGVNMPHTYYAFLHFGQSGYYAQFNAFANTLRFRASSETDKTPDWKTIAFTSSTVANADKLDGVHENQFARFDGDARSESSDLFRFIGYAYSGNDSVWNTSGPAFGFGANANYHKLIQGSASANNLYIKTCVNGTYTVWREFAFTDSNVASASKLKPETTGAAPDLNTIKDKDYLVLHKSLSNQSQNIAGATDWVNSLINIPLHNNGSVMQMLLNNSGIRIRTCNGEGVWSEWKRLAFTTTDNVASATKLNDDTEFKVWGKPFFKNGKPQNVSGDLTIDGKITGESLQIGDVEITPQMLGSGNQYLTDPIYQAAVRSSAIDVTFSAVEPIGGSALPDDDRIGISCSVPQIILCHTNYGNVRPYAKWLERIDDRVYPLSASLVDYPAFSGGPVIVRDKSGKLGTSGSGYYIYDSDAGTLTPVHFLDVIS